MNIIICILLIIAGLVALLLIIALFTKKEYVIERDVKINKSKQKVFDYIKYLKNQDNFSKWATMDLNMKKEYRGTDGTVGFVSAWDSENKQVGKGEQEIKKIIEGERLETKLHFIKPFEGLAEATFITEAITPEETKVIWRFNSQMKYPMNLMLLFMNMDKMIGKDLKIGLMNLKVVLEAPQG